jgi:hypothetical protein
MAELMTVRLPELVNAKIDQCPHWVPTRWEIMAKRKQSKLSKRAKLRRGNSAKRGKPRKVAKSAAAKRAKPKRAPVKRAARKGLLPVGPAVAAEVFEQSAAVGTEEENTGKGAEPASAAITDLLSHSDALCS